MRLIVDGTQQHFIPLKDFRASFNLPATFSVAMFQPKTWEGLGSIDRAGAALNTVKAHTVAAVPSSVSAADWPHHIPQLAQHFETELRSINATIGLRDEEIDFAVNGFADVCHAVSFAIVRAKVTHTTIPDFAQIYSTWLNDSVTVSGNYYDYQHHEATWTIRVVLHAYGRVGLVVQMPTACYYVVDKQLTCPAEGYMAGLLEAVAEKMIAATI